jgi:hypothetical protein
MLIGMLSPNRASMKDPPADFLRHFVAFSHLSVLITEHSGSGPPTPSAISSCLQKA